MLLATLTLFCCLTAPGEVTVDQETLALGDLIRFPATDPRAAIALGRAPAPGLARKIARYEILSKLQLSGQSVDDLDLPEFVLVRRAAQQIDPDRVRALVLQQLQDRFPDSQVMLTRLDVPPVDVATGGVDLHASLPPGFDPSAPVFVRLEVRAPGYLRSVHARAEVRIESMQPVVLTAVRAHEEVREDQIEWRPMPLRKTVGAIQTAGEIRGLAAKRDLAAGQVLTGDLLYAPVLVHRGDLVTVKATAGGITIAATMKAKGSGRLGETVVVEHISGLGSVAARVTGPRTLAATPEERR